MLARYMVIIVLKKKVYGCCISANMSSIIVTCHLGPIRNAVLPSESRFPSVNVIANLIGWKKTSIDKSVQVNLAAKQMAKP